MIRATRILRRDALSGGEIVDRVVLDHGDRHRRRVAMRGAGGWASCSTFRSRPCWKTAMP
ncbi:hypothetical protein ACRBEV_13020 [Methylobacterium phyllosphaerae]